MRMNQTDNGNFGALLVGSLRAADGMNTEKQQRDYEEIDSLHGVERPLV